MPIVKRGIIEAYWKAYNKNLKAPSADEVYAWVPCFSIYQVRSVCNEVELPLAEEK